MDLPKILRQSPLFAGTTDEDIAAILRICRVREYERGEVLFDEGDIAQGFYIVAAGRVKVYKLSPEGKERILHVVQPGGNFAEAAIFADGLYPASAEPLEKSTLIFFPKRDFLDLLTAQGRIAINMIGGLSRFLRLFAGQIEELTFRDVPSRLARYLLDLNNERNGAVELPTSKSAIASRLGTVSETLSRTFRKFSDEGLIRVEGKIIVILDAERLSDLAERFVG
ncbi:MAG: Crp/Fnr family transcriptional regulator [Desulfuromonadales bacterium]|nr:Crp/Fnr family transcriptional regulator [Desulfuromonadales bacterium]